MNNEDYIKQLEQAFIDVLSKLEYAHITGEWAYDYKGVSDFISGMYDWKEEHLCKKNVTNSAHS